VALLPRAGSAHEQARSSLPQPAATLHHEAFDATVPLGIAFRIHRQLLLRHIGRLAKLHAFPRGSVPHPLRPLGCRTVRHRFLKPDGARSLGVYHVNQARARAVRQALWMDARAPLRSAFAGCDLVITFTLPGAGPHNTNPASAPSTVGSPGCMPCPEKYQIGRSRPLHHQAILLESSLCSDVGRNRRFTRRPGAPPTATVHRGAPAWQGTPASQLLSRPLAGFGIEGRPGVSVVPGRAVPFAPSRVCPLRSCDST